MLFSYYFDPEKTHLLNFSFTMLQYTEKEAGAIEVMFSAEIAEILNGITKKKEVIVSAFTFPHTTDKTKHDIDFTRVRYGTERKWIFTIINNKDASQNVQVGLISHSANKNPMGMDIYHKDETYDANLKANNLSILEGNYIPPILKQTIVNATFEQAGYPERFSSYTAQYNKDEKNYTVKDFIQDFLEPIPATASFDISLDIAPLSVTAASGSKVFSLNVTGLGEVNVYRTGLEFTLEGGTGSDSVYASFNREINPDEFFIAGTMTSSARLRIVGGGNGTLTVSYAGETLSANYDHTKEIKGIKFRGEYAGQIL